MILRKSIVLTGCALAVVIVIVMAAVINDVSDPPSEQAIAQDSDRAPILEKEVRSWCPDSCSGGNDEYESSPATFTLRPDGSMHFITDVNYAACPSMTIPDNVNGWFFGASRESIQSQFATAQAAGDDGVTYQTSGVQEIDDDARQNPDLMICEAVFFRGDD